MKSVTLFSLLILLVVGGANAADQDAELKQFQGHWEAVELSEDGHVIPQEAIAEWLPSGGRMEIAESAILMTSPHDGKKSAKVFSIDATQYPKGLDIVTREKKEAVGIYRFDEGKLIVCLSDPEEGSRPTEFSAREGSKRMLMVLKRVPAPEADKKPAPAPANPPITAGSDVAAKVLTDAEVTRLLQGTWKYKDEAGALIVSMTENAAWSSVRESQQLRLFQKVFVRTPISNGRWGVKQGTLTFHCLTSVIPSRVNQQLSFTVRSISDRDFIFVDHMGRLGKATRVQ